MRLEEHPPNLGEFVLTAPASPRGGLLSPHVPPCSPRGIVGEGLAPPALPPLKGEVSAAG